MRIVSLGVLWVAAVGCNGVRDRAEQMELSVNHIESPSKAWVAGKSIEDGKWLVEIQGRGEQRFQDAPGLDAHYKVYWAWDDHDRLWLFDSAEGKVRYYTGGPNWTRSVWDVSYTDKGQAAFLCRQSEAAGAPAPPESLHPFFVNSSVRTKLATTLGKECKPPEWEY